MPFSYSPQYRQMVLVQVRSGRLVAELAGELEVSAATIHRWKSQDEIDRGQRAGTSSGESAELRAARQRIAELERELLVTRRASELFAEDRVVRPKALHRIVEVLSQEGHAITFCCRVLGIAPSGYFRQASLGPSPQEIRRHWLTDRIVEIWHASRQTYGWQRIAAEIRHVDGHIVNHKLVRKIMRAKGIAGLPSKRRPRSVSGSNRYTTADLVRRKFERERPNQLWMTDITEHPTREGTLYCCCVLDAYSRRIVGWAIDRRATTAMVNSALGMAIRQRTRDTPTLLHTDHGPQFTSWAFSQALRQAGLIQSIGAVGDAYDNAVIESFWGSMQIELLNRKMWATQLELSGAIVDWIEGFYNRRRRHSSLGNISPIEFERRHQPTAA